MSERLDQIHTDFLENGYCVFEADSEIRAWVSRTLPAALKAVHLEQNKHWLRHGNTWFAGVNVLDNDATGKVNNGLAIQGQAARFLREKLKADMNKLDRAQVSVCYPGYPLPSSREDSTGFAYRKNQMIRKSCRGSP